MATSSDPGICGVIHHNKDGGLVNIPLSKVTINALIIDVSARVTLTQVFYNPSEDPTPRAKYAFPVPARAAICAFEMRCGDRVLHGVAKERQLAKEEHEKAMRDGKLTSLVEWATDDLFTISLGSIPGLKTVVTMLTYTIDLMTGDYVDEVRFQLPMCIGQRYGRVPDGMVDASTMTSRTRVRVQVNIQTKGIIKEVTSPSHTTLTLTPYGTHQGRPSRHRTTAEFSSLEYLTQDFILSIHAEELDIPRCFLERDPKGSQSVAMQLTMVPKFDLPPIQTQEYLFVVDRSGSMSGTRISTAKRTLTMLLRILPGSGTSFNIFSFGTEVDSMYGSSQQYSDHSLSDATMKVERMDADYGGTEIRSALQFVFSHRNKSIPTAVFVLTDGEAYDIDATIDTVTQAVAQAPVAAGIRVFTLGIGTSASSAMCEGIARAGKGVCLMAPDAETILPKCAKLVRAGKTFVLRNVTIDWGVPPDALVVDREGSSVRFTGQDAVLRQTPSYIESIYPGNRFVIFALIKLDKFVIPEHVTLRGQRDGEGNMVEIKIPVEHVKFTNEEPRIPLIHTLAARQLITELQEDRDVSILPEDHKKASIIRLGEQYQLASRYTSFVAVEGQETEPSSNRGRSVGTRFPRRSRVSPERRRTSDSNLEAAASGVGSFFISALEYTSSFLSAIIGSFIEPYSSTPSRTSNDAASPVPGGYRTPTPDSLRSQPRRRRGEPADDESDAGHETDNTFTTMSSLESYSDSVWSDEDEDVSKRPPPPDESTRSPSPQFQNRSGGSQDDGEEDGGFGTWTARGGTGSIAPRVKRTTSRRPQMGAPVPAPPQVTDSVYDLVRLQSFDGSFSLENKLTTIVGQAALEDSARPADVDEKIWATALAVAYFQKHLTGQPELLDSLVEKAMEFASVSGLSSRGSLDFRSLIEWAKGLVT